MLNLVNYRLKVTLFVLGLQFALSIRPVDSLHLIWIRVVIQERRETIDRADVGV
jgi:hypothetical protein